VTKLGAVHDIWEGSIYMGMGLAWRDQNRAIAHTLPKTFILPNARL